MMEVDAITLKEFCTHFDLDFEEVEDAIYASDITYGSSHTITFVKEWYLISVLEQDFGEFAILNELRPLYVKLP